MQQHNAAYNSFMDRWNAGAPRPDESPEQYIARGEEQGRLEARKAYTEWMKDSMNAYGSLNADKAGM
jgi:hypothetical protein